MLAIGVNFKDVLFEQYVGAEIQGVRKVAVHLGYGT
jgi:hypothetical protein